MSDIQDAARRLAGALPTLIRDAHEARSGDRREEVADDLTEALTAFGEACAGRIEPGPCETEARTIAREIRDEHAALRLHAIQPVMLKPFPVPGSMWEWLGNDIAKPMAPRLVTGLRWFRGQAEAMFGEDIAVDIEHMMNLREWRCVCGPPTVDSRLTAAELDAVIDYAEAGAVGTTKGPAWLSAMAKLRAARGTR